LKKYSFILFLLLVTIQLCAGVANSKHHTATAATAYGYGESSQLPADEFEGHTVQFHTAVHKNSRMHSIDGCDQCSYRLNASIAPGKKIIFPASCIHAKRYLDFIYPSHNFW
jgi:hypothetical protein